MFTLSIAPELFALDLLHRMNSLVLLSFVRFLCYRIDRDCKPNHKNVFTYRAVMRKQGIMVCVTSTLALCSLGELYNFIAFWNTVALKPRRLSLKYRMLRRAVDFYIDFVSTEIISWCQSSAPLDKQAAYLSTTRKRIYVDTSFKVSFLPFYTYIQFYTFFFFFIHMLGANEHLKTRKLTVWSSAEITLRKLTELCFVFASKTFHIRYR